MAKKKKGRRRAVRANGVATRARIMRAATRLFSESGYEATSLRQIAIMADIDSATLKYHFGDKQNLFGEVYRVGHEAFLSALLPLLGDLRAVESRGEFREVFRAFIREMHAFVDEELSFVRLTLYRMLENTDDVIAVEDELQSVAIATVEATFDGLAERGIIRDVDTRAFVVFIISSLSSWSVTGRVKPRWLGEPALASPMGQARSEEFFIDLMERYLLGPSLLEA